LLLILVIGTVGYEEVYPCEDSPSVGSTIKQVEEKFPGVKMSAFKKKDGALVPSPNPETIIGKDWQSNCLRHHRTARSSGTRL